MLKIKLKKKLKNHCFREFSVKHSVFRTEKLIKSCHFDRGAIPIPVHFSVFDKIINPHYSIIRSKTN